MSAFGRAAERRSRASRPRARRRGVRGVDDRRTPAGARRYAREGLELALRARRQAADRVGDARPELRTGKTSIARALLREREALLRELGDEVGLAWVDLPLRQTLFRVGGAGGCREQGSGPLPCSNGWLAAGRPRTPGSQVGLVLAGRGPRLRRRLDPRRRSAPRWSWSRSARSSNRLEVAARCPCGERRCSRPRRRSLPRRGAASSRRAPRADLPSSLLRSSEAAARARLAAESEREREAGRALSRSTRPSPWRSARRDDAGAMTSTWPNRSSALPRTCARQRGRGADRGVESRPPPPRTRPEPPAAGSRRREVPRLRLRREGDPRLVPGEQRASSRKLRDAVGCREVRIAEADYVERVTGFEPVWSRALPLRRVARSWSTGR